VEPKAKHHDLFLEQRPTGNGRPFGEASKGHGNDSDTEGTHHRKLMHEPPLAAAGVH
jgi:hypothetical protein